MNIESEERADLDPASRAIEADEKAATRIERGKTDDHWRRCRPAHSVLMPDRFCRSNDLGKTEEETEMTSNDWKHLLTMTISASFIEAKRARHSVAAAPYGFVRVRDESGRPSVKIHEDEAEIVRHAFRFARDHDVGPAGIARYLNNAGLRPRRGGKWSASAINRIVQNPIYAGHVPLRRPSAVGNTKGSKITELSISVPRIISRKLFDRVQRMLRDRSSCRRHAVSRGPLIRKQEK